jgi:3-oxoacyl-[acyl-carrier protein] reductase
MDLGITGKTAIICAASKGLGYGCAEALAEAGANVVICARSEGPLEEAAEKLRAYGGSVTAIACDSTTDA